MSKLASLPDLPERIIKLASPSSSLTNSYAGVLSHAYVPSSLVQINAQIPTIYKGLSSYPRTSEDLERIAKASFGPLYETLIKTRNAQAAGTAAGLAALRETTSRMNWTYQATKSVQFVWASEEQKAWYECMKCKNDGRELEYARMLYDKNRRILDGYQEFLRQKGAL